MKITIINNKVVCTQEDFNKLFWDKVSYDCFDYDVLDEENTNHNKVYLALLIRPLDYDYRTDYLSAELDFSTLKYVIAYANTYNVSVDEQVIKRCKELEKIVHEGFEKRRKIEETEKAKQHWNYLCKNGCGRCTNLRYDIDMPWCKATHDKLKEENKPDYDDNGVYRLFSNLVPFPSDNCPFKI